MLIKTYGSAVYGIDALTITVEVNIGRGVKFFLVGLPDNAVKESYQRISAALKNNGHRIPGKEVTVNMAPADIRKEGSSYDITIAIGILAASGHLSRVDEVGRYIIMGELSLDGELRPLKGALPIALHAKKQGFKGVILPYKNAKEAALVDDLEILGAKNIGEVINFFNDSKDAIEQVSIDVRTAFEQKKNSYDLDFSDVKGQESVKRGLEIAAGGGHNIILIGPPGSGKTMLSKRIPSILPPLTMEEALETTKIHSVAGTLNHSFGLIKERPFRSPHHTVSEVALVGGGSNPKPGEISLANNGILFLDELPEFKRAALEVLRQPLEDRLISISRARMSVDYPANFMLVAAMNPSPSGDFYDPSNPNGESEVAIKRYLSRISGPLLDRIDLQIEVQPVPYEKLANQREEEDSATIRARVVRARNIQKKRFANHSGIHCNAQLTPKLQKIHCKINSDSERLMKQAMDHLGLSARSYGRIFKVARTIADLDGSKNIETAHIAEAIQYRSLDKNIW